MNFNERIYEPFNQEAAAKKISRRNLLKLLGITGIAGITGTLAILGANKNSEKSQSIIENDKEAADNGEAFDIILGNAALELEVSLADNDHTAEEKQALKQELAKIDRIARDLLKIKALLSQAASEKNLEKQQALKESAQKIAEEVYRLAPSQDTEAPTIMLEDVNLHI